MSIDAYRERFFRQLCEAGDDASGRGLYADAEREALHRDSLPFLEALPMDFETLLDVGCGAGYDARWFARRGKSVVGITGSPTPAQEGFAADHGFEIREMDLHALDFPDGSLDAILCKHCLEHSFSPLGGLWEMRRVLKNGGYLFLVVPPHRDDLVESGHFTQGWSLGQLVYCLAVTGYDVRGGAFRQRPGHVEAVVQRAEAVPEARALHQLRDWMPDPIRPLMREDRHGAFPSRHFRQIAWPFAGPERETIVNRDLAGGIDASTVSLRALARHKLRARGPLAKLLSGIL